MNLAILQSRMSSSRLPGKVLAPILGQPMILRQVERLRRARRLDRLVVATSTDPSDDILAEVCRAADIECERGSLDDVLDRFWQVAHKYLPANVVRLTADCPLIDAELVDEVVAFHIDHGFDYTSNVLDPTFPDGLSAEVVRSECLERASREARLPSEREHVTPYFYKHRDLFRVGSYRGEPDLSALRWTVDHPEDLQFVRSVYAALYPSNPAFGTQDVLALLDREPALRSINARFERYEGYKKSLAEDRAVLSGAGRPDCR